MHGSLLFSLVGLLVYSVFALPSISNNAINLQEQLSPQGQVNLSDEDCDHIACLGNYVIDLDGAPPDTVITLRAGDLSPLSLVCFDTFYIEECELPAQASIQELPKTIEAATLENQEHLALTVFPNPSKYKTNLQFQLPETTSVHLFISDLNGRIIQTVKTGANEEAGIHQLQIDLSDLSGGIYNVHLLISLKKIHRRMVVTD